MSKRAPGASRRCFLVGAAGLVTAANVGGAAMAEAPNEPITIGEPFFGLHQAGIVTPSQTQTYVATFDLKTTKRSEVVDLMRRWTEAAARLVAGETAGSLDRDIEEPAPDSADVLGLGAARLTLTFGFGVGLFVKNGVDRYGLANQRPEALVTMPRFNGDQMIEERTGGDLSIQACADDQQVAFHAIRQLARMAESVASLRWSQSGFSPDFGTGKTPRNLMGFKDGTNNKATDTPQAMTAAIWVGAEGPAWMRGGSYAVMRRIRIALEHWDRMDVAFQQATVGRKKYSGAPLTGTRETDPHDFGKTDVEGNPVIPINAHARVASASENNGALIHRRGYSYNDGIAFIAERWPPWHQGMAYDAGSFFVCYQRDPRTGFIKLFDKMSKVDMMNQFTTHVGGGLFACPPGAVAGGFIGQSLFDAA